MTWDRARSEALARRFLIPEDAVDAKERKRRKLVAAAADFFERLGYRKTSMGDVARAAGVAKGTVYLYFESKAELLLYAVIAEKVRFAEPFYAVMAAPDPRSRLRGFLRLTFLTVHQLPLTARLMQRDMQVHDVLDELNPGLAAEIAGGQDEAYRYLLAPFVSDEAELHDRATALVSLVYAASVIGDEGARLGLSPERHAELLADALVAGFAAPSPEPEQG